MPRVEYELSAPRPESHLFHVTVDVRDAGDGPVDLVLPSWTPGSYRIRDYARHVQDFTAGALEWRKVDKARWRIVPRNGAARASFRVWAFELTVRTSHLDEEHGYVNGACVFPYLDGHKEAPVRLRIRAPRGWKIATALESAGPGVFVAPDYDTLIDCPIEMGRFRERTFRARGKPHRLVIHGGGNYDEKRLVRDLRRIVETEAAMMRGLPYEHYTFLLHTTGEGGGGLEHANSTSLQFPPHQFRPREKYENFLELVAHEFFHLWNVKRIHPVQLGPFDYEREVYTTLLWVLEGLTSYYDTLLPCRAKLFAPDRYLKIVAERIQKFEEKPGRTRQSLVRSSFDAWIGLYQPNENAPNCQMSYYEKGGLVGLCLDLEIRRRTGGRRSLDDVMRTLYEEYGRDRRGFPEEEFRRVCERVAGGSLASFFEAYVEGTGEIPWGRFLGFVGLELAREPRKGEDGKPLRTRPWLGVQTQRSGDRVIVTSVIEGSPADRGGLSSRDELVAFDGARVEPDGWEKRIEERADGDRVRVAVFRRGFLREVPVTIAARPNVTFVLRRVAKPSPAQKREYASWLGSPWPARKS